MAELGLNIDHVATLRQARREAEPDPVWAAVIGQLAGAACLTMHLREDRRHVQDHDVWRVRSVCRVKLNLEMAATAEMVRIARRVRADMATLVPEGRDEVTTEGGLDVVSQAVRLKRIVAQLHRAGISVSAFIDAEPRQIDAAAQAGFDYCEVHTGPYARAFAKAQGESTRAALRRELARVRTAGQRIVERGMLFNAGHALNYLNVAPIAALPAVRELHIGHAIVARAVFVGLERAVGEMVGRIKSGE